MKIRIRKIKSVDIDWIKTIFNQRWGGDFIITRGKVHKPETLSGFIAEVDSKKKGLITFKITDKEMEIISLDSLLKKRGIGTMLVSRVIGLAKNQRIKRIWLITTNDNLNALRFWQNRDFRLIKIYPNALTISRKLKPGIPLVGEDGIPLRDEIEIEKFIK
ncbi:MAG: GNAT family N-acetyltransferase [Candidatus Firestonebacteria bacterium]